jgi:hypothetical protein
MTEDRSFTLSLLSAWTRLSLSATRTSVGTWLTKLISGLCVSSSRMRRSSKMSRVRFWAAVRKPLFAQGRIVTGKAFKSDIRSEGYQVRLNRIIIRNSFRKIISSIRNKKLRMRIRLCLKLINFCWKTRFNKI